MLSEPIRSNETTNNMLYIFNKTFSPKDQKIKIEDTKGKLRMSCLPKEILIIKDKEILKYEYVINK